VRKVRAEKERKEQEQKDKEEKERERQKIDAACNRNMEEKGKQFHEVTAYFWGEGIVSKSSFHCVPLCQIYRLIQKIDLWSEDSPFRPQPEEDPAVDIGNFEAIGNFDLGADLTQTQTQDSGQTQTFSQDPLQAQVIFVSVATYIQQYTSRLRRISNDFFTMILLYFQAQRHTTLSLPTPPANLTPYQKCIFYSQWARQDAQWEGISDQAMDEVDLRDYLVRNLDMKFHQKPKLPKGFKVFNICCVQLCVSGSCFLISSLQSKKVDPEKVPGEGDFPKMTREEREKL
jgi:hypothetical protein